MTPRQIFDSNQGLAIGIAKRIAKENPRIEEEDLRQVSLLGLWDAANEFDSSSGNKFTTFGTHYCRGRCSNYVRDFGDLVRKPTKEFWKLPYQGRGLIPKSVMSHTMNPLEVLLEREENRIDKQDLEESMSMIPWEWQYCLERIHMHGDTVGVVAKSLKISSSTVDRWTQTAIWKLSGRVTGKLVMKEKSVGGRGRRTKWNSGC